jgi:hypothetical protein
MIVDSPVGDAKWNVVNGYSFVIDQAAFTSTGKTFGGVRIFDQHNSPAKVGGSNSYEPECKGGASVNTATVVGTPPTGPIVSDDDDATVSVICGPLGSLGDRVWFDSDADGMQDVGEVGITGVKMLLEGDFDMNGSVDYTATTTTGANGTYTFTGLPAGEYKVSVDTATLPVNYAQTYDLDGLATPNSALGELASAQNRTDFDFGYVASAPGFALVKTASVATPAVGQPVTYTYTVSNTGAQPLTDVVVKDDNGTPTFAGDDFVVTNRTGGDTNSNSILDPGETWTYTATVTPPVGLTTTINGQTIDSGQVQWQKLANNDWRVTFLQSQAINDNNYAASGDAPGWNRSHTFSNLTGSDKAGFELKNASGTTVMKFYMDYITSSSTQEIAGEYSSYSGFRSLGVTGGDGSISVGSAANLYDFDSSLEVNLNRAGYTTQTENSPINDPNWDYVMAYSFTVRAAALGGSTLGSVDIFDQHNSPPKIGDNEFNPSETGGEVTNTAMVTAKLNGQTVLAIDDATVIVGGSGGGGGTAKFFVVDIGSDKTFKYSSVGSSVGNFALQSGNTDPRDVAANLDGSKLWVLDKDDNVNVYNGSTGAALGVWKADGLGSEPEGLTLDPSVDPQTGKNDLWIASRDRKIDWYDDAASNTSGSQNSNIEFAPSMSGNLKGIVTDGTFLWAVTEGSTDYVYRFTITRNASTGDPTGLTQSGLWQLASANSKPTGITLDPTGASQSLWVVDESTDTVYAYGNSRSLTSGTGMVSSSFMLAGTNLAAQGIADPLSFGGDDARTQHDPYADVGALLAQADTGLVDTMWLVGHDPAAHMVMQP